MDREGFPSACPCEQIGTHTHTTHTHTTHAHAHTTHTHAHTTPTQYTYTQHRQHTTHATHTHVHVRHSAHGTHLHTQTRVSYRFPLNSSESLSCGVIRSFNLGPYSMLLLPPTCPVQWPPLKRHEPSGSVWLSQTRKCILTAVTFCPRALMV